MISMDKATYTARFKALTGSEAPDNITPDDSVLIPNVLTDRSEFHLSANAIMLYSLLLDHAVRTYRPDEDGDLYFTYSIPEVMNKLNCTQYAATKAMKELVREYLIYKYYETRTHETRLYIKLPFAPEDESEQKAVSEEE